jgi:hypothetical protein
MSYPILDPSRRNPALASKCALAVMAKAPRPGKVKTRLSPPLTMEQAAALNICFLGHRENIAEVAATSDASGLVCYTPVGDEACLTACCPTASRSLRNAATASEKDSWPRQKTSWPVVSAQSALSTPTRRLLPANAAPSGGLRN